MLNIIIFGIGQEAQTLLSYVQNQKKINHKQTDDYDIFLSYLSIEEPQAVFILMDGAMGMEGAIAVKNLYPKCPVIWISNDKGFGIQSYRLGCAFFSVKPLTEKTILTALKKVECALSNDEEITTENRFAHLDDITIQKISHSQNAEELIAQAQKYGVTITKEEAVNYFRYLDDIRYGELDDDMLGQISGGNYINHFRLFFDSTQEF